MLTKNPVLLVAYNMGSISGSWTSYFSSSTIPSSKSIAESDAWHLSVFVFNMEYSYGMDGISVRRMDSRADEIMVIGYTSKSRKELDEYIENLADWSTNAYDVLDHNCQHFAEIILNFLGIEQHIPMKFKDLPKTLCQLLGPLKSVASKLSQAFYKSSGSNSGKSLRGSS